MLVFVCVCEGGGDGAAPAGDQAAGQVVQSDAAADGDAKPSTTMAGEQTRTVVKKLMGAVGGSCGRSSNHEASRLICPDRTNFIL